MANWCDSIVQFEGEDKTLKNLESYFTLMAAKEKAENWGQLPTFSRADNVSYFFYTNYKDGVLYYETKWCPNLEVLREVADHFKVGFTSDYSEIDLQVFGQATYRNGILKDIFLEPDDFNLFEYNQQEIPGILKIILMCTMRKFLKSCLKEKWPIAKRYQLHADTAPLLQTSKKVNKAKGNADP
jgi:Ferredoxin-like domain in Api92-like protein